MIQNKPEGSKPLLSDEDKLFVEMMMAGQAQFDERATQEQNLAAAIRAIYETVTLPDFVAQCKERVRLRALLERTRHRMHHTEGCDCYKRFPQGVCTCGLSSLLAELDKELQP